MFRRAALALVPVLLAAAPALHAEDAAPATGKALLADFVEISSRQVMRRDAGLIELMNLSQLTLDVEVGASATTLKPNERMLAGVEPGVVPVKVVARGVTTGPLEGDLQVDGGRHYQLAFAYDVPPDGREASESAASRSTVARGAAREESGADAPPAPEGVKAAPARSRGGKVDIGRRRH